MNSELKYIRAHALMGDMCPMLVNVQRTERQLCLECQPPSQKRCRVQRSGNLDELVYEVQRGPQGTEAALKISLPLAG